MGLAVLGSRPIRAAGLVVLARLLSPSDFGVVALAMVIFSSVDLITGMGMEQALIYTSIDTRRAASHAFIAVVLSSVIMFLVVNAYAPFFAGFLGDTELIPVIRWLSALIIIDALMVVPRALLKKEMNFADVGKSLLVAEVASNVVAIALAVLGFGFWSLVYAKLASNTAKLIVVWVACRDRSWVIPRGWDWSVFRQLRQYGFRSMGSGILSFFNTNSDDWIVGRVLGITALGYYSKAYNLSNQTLAGIQRKVINSVLFPAFAKVQKDKERLSRIFLKSLNLIMILMVPMSLGLTVIAPELVPVLFGDKWLPMVPVLQVFGVQALVRMLSGSSAPLFQAVGRPEFNFRTGLLQTGILIPMILYMLSSGIVGVAVAVTITYAVGYAYNLYQLHKVIPRTLVGIVPAIFPSLLAGAAMVVGVILAKPAVLRLAGGENNLLNVVLLVVLGATIYGSAALILQRDLLPESIRLVKAAVGGNSRLAFRRR